MVAKQKIFNIYKNQVNVQMQIKIAIKAAQNVNLKKANAFVLNVKMDIPIQLIVMIKVNVSNAKMDVSYVDIWPMNK